MKKTIILAAMLALPTFAGQKVIVNQAPVAPVVTAPAVASQWSVEGAFTYNWALSKIWKNADTKKKLSSVMGGDITGVYALDENQAVTLRFGYTWAGKKTAYSGGHNKVRQHTFYLMPGYRYTCPIATDWSFFAGVNVGVANASTKDTDYLDVNWDGERVRGKDSSHKAAWGFAYSIEAGVRYACTENIDVFFAWDFNGNTASCKFKEGGKTKPQINTGFRVGVGVKF